MMILDSAVKKIKVDQYYGTMIKKFEQYYDIIQNKNNTHKTEPLLRLYKGLQEQKLNFFNVNELNHHINVRFCTYCVITDLSTSES